MDQNCFNEFFLVPISLDVRLYHLNIYFCPKKNLKLFLLKLVSFGKLTCWCLTEQLKTIPHNKTLMFVSVFHFLSSTITINCVQVSFFMLVLEVYPLKQPLSCLEKLSMKKVHFNALSAFRFFLTRILSKHLRLENTSSERFSCFKGVFSR
jgi:hypothetical protein